MGLSLSHDAWDGAYSAWNRYRNTVAEIAGYWVAKVEYDDGYKGQSVMIDWGHLPPDALDGRWGRVVPSDALLYLIAHSDCEGYLEPAACGRLANRLEELLPLIAAHPDDQGHIGSWGAKTQKLIDGLRRAHAARQRLSFH